MLLITSDPLISSLRNVSKKKINTYPREVLNLLIASEPDVVKANSATNTSDIISDSEESDTS